MGQRKIALPPSSLEKINAVVMGKDGVGKSGKNISNKLLFFMHIIFFITEDVNCRVSLRYKKTRWVLELKSLPTKQFIQEIL